VCEKLTNSSRPCPLRHTRQGEQGGPHILQNRRRHFLGGRWTQRAVPQVMYCLLHEACYDAQSGSCTMDETGPGESAGRPARDLATQ